MTFEERLQEALKAKGLAGKEITVKPDGVITKTIKVVKVNDQISLGYSTQSGVKIIYKDGLPFKDLNKNGQLDKYEDWRLNY